MAGGGVCGRGRSVLPGERVWEQVVRLDQRSVDPRHSASRRGRRPLDSSPKHSTFRFNNHSATFNQWTYRDKHMANTESFWGVSKIYARKYQKQKQVVNDTFYFLKSCCGLCIPPGEAPCCRRPWLPDPQIAPFSPPSPLLSPSPSPLHIPLTFTNTSSRSSARSREMWPVQTAVPAV